MIEPQGVVHFSIAVSDLARFRKFYTKVLGLKFVNIRDPDGNVIEFSEWDGTSILD